MSRVAKKPIAVPKNVNIDLNGQELNIKGGKGQLHYAIHPLVAATLEDNVLKFAANEESIESNALAGTSRAIIQNMIIGVSEGFTRKLLLVGVGYRAQAQGHTLNLTLGYSHPVKYDLPAGIVAETPSNTEIILHGIDKQLLGKVASEIRAFRPPEPYKGKGIRYSDEVIIIKETKKK